MNGYDIDSLAEFLAHKALFTSQMQNCTVFNWDLNVADHSEVEGFQKFYMQRCEK